MSGDPRPLLALANPESEKRFKQSPRPTPNVSGPGAARQSERLGPRFRDLESAFEGKRAELSEESPDEVDPELVLVFELAGTADDFYKAVKRVEGLEFLAEQVEDKVDPDDEFHMVQGKERRRTDAKVGQSLYLVMSNAKAAGQLVSWFAQWSKDPDMDFGYGKNKFKKAFAQLRTIRPWGTEDRVRQSGLVDKWREDLEVVGESISPRLVEIELWYRSDPEKRAAAEAHVRDAVESASGEVKDRADISSISYHALLVELPMQRVHDVLNNGASSVKLLTVDEIMFVSPYTPMTISQAVSDQATGSLPPAAETRIEGEPRIAILDGLPLANHQALVNRIEVDDPDGLSDEYPLERRAHGTSMASQVIHGDLSAPSEPLARSLYVRPIMVPHEVLDGSECVVPDRLFPDLLHRAIRRIVEGDGDHAPAAPSVRIVNLSVGAKSRALVRRMSPVGRLLDWLAIEYNLLFVVSAGNHDDPIAIPPEYAADQESAGRHAVSAVRSSSRLHGITPPGDAMNAVTVGATHQDAAGEIGIPDDVWDLTHPGSPALYSATGPGVEGSVKPDLLHSGGRALYSKPPVDQESDTVEFRLVEAKATAPGIRVAAPGRQGALNATTYTYGTSNATALVTREADRIFDILEAGADADDLEFPDALYHPVLTRALLVHASEWGGEQGRLRDVLDLDGRNARRNLTTLLGYGTLDVARLGLAATNRAVLIGAGSIEPEQRRTYHIPLPSSLRFKAEQHRVTVTLASMVPTVGWLTKYRSAKVFFDKPDKRATGGINVEADHNAVKRGSCQHEIIENAKAMVPDDEGSFPIHVQCMKDAQKLKKGQSIRYGLVVSIETQVETSNTIHDEVRTQLRVQARDQARGRIAG